MSTLPFEVAPRTQPVGRTYRISGRVVDSHGFAAAGAKLTIGTEEGQSSFGSLPGQLRPDGSFVTSVLAPGTYVLEVRSALRSRETGREGALAIVTVRSSDLDGVVIRTRPGFAVTGRFRMDTDNASAAWPPHIVVQAMVAHDGSGMLGFSVAEGAPAGTFVFRDVYGPRVVRCGYTLAPGNPWWPGHVLLDGVDITDVPTDLSTIQNGQLEVVFTQHPARFSGSVTDSRGRTVPHAWVVTFSADRARWQRWSASAQIVRADFKGTFNITALPGRYLVTAVSPEAFRTEHPVLRDFERLSQGAVTIELKDRERKALALRMNTP